MNNEYKSGYNDAMKIAQQEVESFIVHLIDSQKDSEGKRVILQYDHLKMRHLMSTLRGLK